VHKSQGEEGCIVQQQLPHGGMGLKPANTRVYGVCTPHQGTCPSAKAECDLPHNSTPHCGGGELNDGYPLTFFRQQTQVALQV
jgi:hypothetical protein